MRRSARAYKTFNSLELTNVIRLQLFREILLAKASTFKSPIAFKARSARTMAANTLLLRNGIRDLRSECNYIFGHLGETWIPGIAWTESIQGKFIMDRSHHSETTKGVVYRIYNGVFYAYSLQTVRNVIGTHAVVVMLHCVRAILNTTSAP